VASEDGEEGMKLKDFIEMWTKDGTRLVEQESQQVNGYKWILYAAYFPDSTWDYGRHMAMVLKVNKDDVIVMHDLTNISGEVGQYNKRTLNEWWKRHAGKY